MEPLLEQETDGDNGAGLGLRLDTWELERERRLIHEGRRVALCGAASSSPTS